MSAAALTAADITGTWYLNANGARLTAVISGGGPFAGVLTNEGGGTETLDNIGLNGNFLEFRRDGSGFFQWYRLLINQGVAAGRFSHGAASSKPALSTFAWHATGWKSEPFPGLPLAWELLVNGNYRARVRIDQTSSGSMTGRMKVYATVSGGASGEELESDLTSVAWDGTHLSFTRNLPGEVQIYNGIASGRTISGTFSDNGSGAFAWSGTRAEVLSYGVGSGRSAAASASRLARLRSRLATLMMAGNPGATLSSSQLSSVALLTGAPAPDRDDDSANFPQRYTLRNWTNVYGLTSAFDNSATVRNVHGYLARPTTAPPSRGYPVLIAVNGHGGSAYQTMSPPNAFFWYGDAFARRGYLVVAVDISHRAPGETPLYNDYPNGDDASHGNGAHPSIKNSTGGTDWEEDGERTWDVMRAVDFALSQPNIDASHILISGISMGGEVATIAAAMDSRIAMSIAAGYSPDLGVMIYHGNHPCWQWAFGDIREYVDIADFEALLAPRPLIVETGKIDNTFSSASAPFAADKQAIRRARSVFADQGVSNKLVHYLHYDQHHYHVGSVSPSKPALGVQAVSVGEPNPPGSLGWQTDATTFNFAPTLFSAITTLLP